MAGDNLQIRSRVSAEGFIELSLRQAPVPEPEADEVVVRVEASPINPSDLGLLIASADVTQATSTGIGQNRVVRAPLSAAAMKALSARLDQALPVGNEASGLVTAAGSDPTAQALLRLKVAIFGGAMYARYRKIKASDCMTLPDGARYADGASCFVNPLTALGMVETMRREGHKGLVHTAAASNLGHMLAKICAGEKIPLVNIVRSPAQVESLKAVGAVYVLDSSSDDFDSQLVAALRETGATLAFDAIGGGTLASRILQAMEAAAVANMAGGFSRYGSTTHKQVYIYGGLDLGPTQLNRAYGMAWGLGGWLLMPFLAKIGPAAAEVLRQRVRDELTTTFASAYAAEISLVEALDPDILRAYAKRATGTKHLIRPWKDA